MTLKESQALRKNLESLLEIDPEDSRKLSEVWHEIVYRFTGIPPHQQRGFTKTPKEANP